MLRNGPGCNVENAAYSLATCAERTAIVKAVSEGRKEFDTIVVCALNHSNYISPCGGCRQIMSEVIDRLLSENLKSLENLCFGNGDSIFCGDKCLSAQAALRTQAKTRTCVFIA